MASYRTYLAGILCVNAQAECLFFYRMKLKRSLVWAHKAYFNIYLQTEFAILRRYQFPGASINRTKKLADSDLCLRIDWLRMLPVNAVECVKLNRQTHSMSKTKSA